MFPVSGRTLDEGKRSASGGLMIPEMAAVDQDADCLGKVRGSFNDKSTIIELECRLPLFGIC
jgi:hypothetical protein